jgi:hypothetical protein
MCVFVSVGEAPVTRVTSAWVAGRRRGNRSMSGLSVWPACDSPGAEVLTRGWGCDRILQEATERDQSTVINKGVISPWSRIRITPSPLLPRFFGKAILRSREQGTPNNGGPEYRFNACRISRFRLWDDVGICLSKSRILVLNVGNGIECLVCR